MGVRELPLLVGDFSTKLSVKGRQMLNIAIFVKNIQISVKKNNYRGFVEQWC